jgi:hypothetical protein
LGKFAAVENIIGYLILLAVLSWFDNGSAMVQQAHHDKKLLTMTHTTNCHPEPAEGWRMMRRELTVASLSTQFYLANTA